jgi:hypothetical protein
MYLGFARESWPDGLAVNTVEKFASGPTHAHSHIISFNRLSARQEQGILYNRQPLIFLYGFASFLKDRR